MVDLISRNEAAKVLGISTDTLDRWTRQGLLTACRIGPRLVRYERAELERVLRPQAKAKA